MNTGIQTKVMLVWWLISFALLLIYAYGVLVGYEYQGRPLIDILF